MTESFNRKLGRLAQNVSGTGTITSNAATASAWQTARTITLGGDLSGSVSIDGSSNVSLTATVSGDAVVLGTDTTGNYVATIAAGSGISVSGSGSETAAVTVSIDNTVATLTGEQTLTNKTLTTPVISSITNTGTLTLPTSTDTLVGRATSDTLTNKTISGSNNTISNIGNGSLTNSSITVNGTSIALGGSGTLVTDDISEDGSPVNLWFTNTRARSAVSATDAGGDGSFSYDSGTGVFTYTGPSAAEVRAHFTAGTGLTYTTGQFAIDSTVATLTGSQTLTNKTISGADNTLSNIANSSLTNSSITINGGSVSLGGTRTLVTDDIAEDGSPVNLWYTDTRSRAAISVTDSGGDGSLSYNSGSGVITYTGPSAAEVRAHFSAGTGVSISSGQVSIGQAVATTDNVTFAGVTADNIRVGVTGANEIDTSSGNLTIDSTGGTTILDDDVNVTGNLLVDGNLTVSGTTVTVNTTNLAVEDNMIYLNNGSAVANPDLGFAGNYNDGTYRHAGVFRDASDGVWKFFHQYTPEPDASPYIDITHGSFALAPVQASSFTGSLTGNVTGNASTATAWATARTLTLSGDVTGTSAAFDGSGNISITTTIAADSVALGTDTTGDYVASVAVAGTGLSVAGSGENATYTITSNATSANTGSTIVARDASGNFTAGTITAALSGNATTVTNGVYTTGDQTIGGSKTFSSALIVNKASQAAGADAYHMELYAPDSGTSDEISMRFHQGNRFYHQIRARAGFFRFTQGNSDSLVDVYASTFYGALSGNATTATTLQTARNINGVSFNGSADITVADSTKLPLAGGTVSGQTSFTGGGTTANVVLDKNIASPANYYNGLQLEVRATSGTAGIGLHRNGYSHVGIYHDAVNSIKFNMNSGTVTMDYNTGTVLGSGNYNSYTPTLTGGGASGTWGINISGVINTTAAGGSVLIKHSVSEVDAWIFQENAANWGLYYKNNPTGQKVFGGYTSVGAETVGMSAANVSGNGVLTDNFVGATSAYAQFMLSHYTGYIWSASTIYAATSMVVGGNLVLHAGNYGSYALPLSGGTVTGATTFSAQATDFGNGGGDTGIGIYHGNASGSYGRIRFYQAGSNNQTIHAFPTTWQGGNLNNASAGAINLTGANGVTFGNWNDIAGSIDNSGNTYIKGYTTIGTTTRWNNEILGVQRASDGSFSTVPALMRLSNNGSGRVVKLLMTDNAIIDGIICMTPVSASGSYFSIGFAGYTEAGLVVMSNGRVGIGTTGPYSRLTLISNSEITGFSLFTPSYIGSTEWGTRIWKNDIGGGIPLQIDTQYIGTWYESVRFNHGLSSSHPSLQSFRQTHLATTAGDVIMVQGGGNVGINTTTFSDVSFGAPALKVQGSRATLGLRSTGSLATIAMIPNNDDSKAIHFNQNNLGELRLYQYSVGGETFVLASNGNVGINATSPSYKLQVGGTAYFSNNVKIVPVSESWGEGLSFLMPTTSTWGGLRWQRQRSGYDGNWAIGYTAIDSSDDLVFIANNGGAQINDIIRLQKSGVVIFNAGNVGIGTASPAYKLDVRDGPIYTRYATSGAGVQWHTQAWLGRYDHVQTASQYPNYLPGAAYGFHATADSDACFFGLITRGSSSNDYNTVIAWGDDGGDILQFRFNNGVIGELTDGGAFRVSNNITAYYSFSDQRLKKNIVHLDTKTSLDKVLALQGVQYEWNEGYREGIKEIGFIAQDVEMIVPEVVRESQRVNDDTIYKQVDYEHLVALLTEGMKEQQKQIDELKNRLNKLQ